jgi:hypothetical protein
VPHTDPLFHSRAVVFCENDDCPEWPQAMGDDLLDAVAAWNNRVAAGWWL